MLTTEGIVFVCICMRYCIERLASSLRRHWLRAGRCTETACCLVRWRLKDGERVRERARERQRKRERGACGGRMEAGARPLFLSLTRSHTRCHFLSRTFPRRENGGAGEGAEGRDQDTLLTGVLAVSALCLSGCVDVSRRAKWGTGGRGREPFLKGNCSHISKIKIDLSKACTKPIGRAEPLALLPAHCTAPDSCACMCVRVCVGVPSASLLPGFRVAIASASAILALTIASASAILALTMRPRMLVWTRSCYLLKTMTTTLQSSCSLRVPTSS